MSCKYDLSLSKKLESLKIADESVRAVCCSDMDFACNFRFSWLILTDTHITKIQNNTIEKSLDFTSGDLLARAVCDCDAAVEQYALCDILRFDAEQTVHGISLSVTTKDGDILLCRAENSLSDGIREFVRAAEIACGMRQHADDGIRKPPAREDKPKSGRIKRSASYMLRLTSFFKPYAGRMTLMVLCVLLVGVMSVATPYLGGSVLYGEIFAKNDALGGLIKTTAWGPALALLCVVGVMLAVKLLREVMNMLHSLITAKIVPFVVRDIKSKVFDAMSKLSLGFYYNSKTGTLMSRVLDDADKVSHMFIDYLPMLLVDGLTLLGVIVVMFTLNWKLAIAALVTIPLFALLAYVLLPRIFVLHGRRFRVKSSMDSIVNDNLTGARVVKAFGKEKQETERFDKYNSGVCDTEMDLVKIENRIFAMFSAASYLIQMAIYAMGGYIILSHSGNFTYATLITFVSYVKMMAGPLETVSNFFMQYSNCVNSAQRIFDILDAPVTVAPPENGVAPQKIKGEIKIEHLSFSYEKGREVLSDVSLSVHEGELLGVVGYSGAGKSTLLNLMSRLYDPDEGRITIDGVDLRDMSMQTLRKNIAMVSQETYIFIGTVAENIAYAKPDATRDEIVAAAIAADAHNFICELTDGYDTVIGSSGRELSGGQKQRISIARAILADPSILILDEATASVDTQTEQNIQSALEQLIRGRTTISVAHRLSTLRNADELVVLSNGRITEQGTHSQLIKQKGIYYSLAVLQARESAMKGVSNEWDNTFSTDAAPHPQMASAQRRQMGPPRGPMPPMFR